jgi:trans-L-3-hydroxyproline dehydratase
VTAEVLGDQQTASRVFFRNVPSFVLALDEQVEVAGVGTVRYDIAFGGAFYAYVDARAFGLRCVPGEHGRLVDLGMRIKRAVSDARSIDHPRDPDLGFLYGTIFIAPPVGDGSHSRNVCIFADGQVDRSPTGTGVSGRMAIHHVRGEVALGQPIVIESLVGSRFTGTALEETTFFGREAIVPGVEGEAFITGRHEFLVDPADPFGAGFFLG